MKNKFLFILFLYFAKSIIAQDFHDFDFYQHQLSREYVEEKITKYLQKNDEIENYYQITAQSLSLFSSLENKENNLPEYTLFFGATDSPFFDLKIPKTLCGARIALDPGHFGGQLAKLEERYVDIDLNGNNYQFNEGTHAFLTAKYLKELLEEHGAIVFLTRERVGEGAYLESFFSFLEQNHQLLNPRRSLSSIFRSEYNPLDLKTRSAKINNFQPDLTLIIHYNAHDCEEENSLKTKITDKNFNLAFVPGAFCEGELKEKESRYHFLRLICTSDLEKSITLSQKVIENFTKHLNVPLIKDEDGAKYLNKSCLKVHNGIWARNLALNRRTLGPICYGESLIQNHEEECLRLSAKDTSINNTLCSSRLKEVAQSYFEAIQQYFEENYYEKTVFKTP